MQCFLLKEVKRGQFGVVRVIASVYSKNFCDMFPHWLISAARVRLPAHILSLISSWSSVYHLVWQWLLTLLCTVAVKMQISQDSAFLFCRQFTVWRPHLLAAEQRTRVSAISILLSLGKMPQYLFAQTAALLSHCKGYRPTRLQAARSRVSNVWGPDIVCASIVSFLSRWQLRENLELCCFLVADR